MLQGERQIVYCHLCFRPETDQAFPKDATTIGKVEFINGIRGLAILMVVWHHWYAKSVANNLPDLLDPMVMAGHFGVEIFFVLSGFVLFLPYAQTDRVFDTKRYLLRRSLRLLPLYYVALFASSAVADAKANPADPTYLLVLFPNSEFIGPAFNFPLWSISAEIWFSALFPVLFLIRNRTATMLAIACAISAVSHLGPIWVQKSIFGMVYLFVLGMLTASLAGKVSCPLWPVGLAFVGPYLPDPYGAPVIGIATSALILYCWSHRGSPIAGLLEARYLQALGMMCFSIYVWHEPVRSVVGGYNAFSPIQLANWALLAVVATLSYRFIEFWHVRNWRDLLPPPMVGTVDQSDAAR